MGQKHMSKCWEKIKKEQNTAMVFQAWNPRKRSITSKGVFRREEFSQRREENMRSWILINFSLLLLGHPVQMSSRQV